MSAHLSCLFHPFPLVKSHGYQQRAPLWLCRPLWWSRNTDHHHWCDHGKAFQSRRCPVIRECSFLFKSYFQPLCDVWGFLPLRLILPPSTSIHKICWATAIVILKIPRNKIFFFSSWYYAIKYRLVLVMFPAISTVQLFYVWVGCRTVFLHEQGWSSAAGLLVLHGHSFK